ncbi:MAG: hypothetical protein ACI9OH_001422 [Oleispira sp.]|jgi:hypothetical protein
MGSARTKRCSNCNGGWSISWISMLWVSIAIIPTFFNNNMPLIFCGLVISLVGITFFTPIVRIDKN